MGYDFFPRAAPMSFREVVQTEFASAGNKTPLTPLINDAAFAALFIFNPFEIYIWCASSIYDVLVYTATRPIDIAGLRLRKAVV